MKYLLTVVFTMTIFFKGFSQDIKTSPSESQLQNKSYSYAYILIQGKLFSKKLKVDVDFGDTPEQLSAGKEYSETLTNKKSYAAVLNYMVESQYELVQTLDYTDNYSGTGGTTGVVFIMRKNKVLVR